MPPENNQNPSSAISNQKKSLFKVGLLIILGVIIFVIFFFFTKNNENSMTYLNYYNLRGANFKIYVNDFIFDEELYGFGSTGGYQIDDMLIDGKNVIEIDISAQEKSVLDINKISGSLVLKKYKEGDVVDPSGEDTGDIVKEFDLQKELIGQDSSNPPIILKLEFNKN